MTTVRLFWNCWKSVDMTANSGMEGSNINFFDPLWSFYIDVSCRGVGLNKNFQEQLYFTLVAVFSCCTRKMDSQAKCHVRSISLPSRVEEKLLKTSQATSSSKLVSLKDLYENVDDLLQLPLTRQALSNEQHREKLEEIVDGSLRLVDMCGTTRDLFSQMKECVQQLESSLRRRRGGESNLVNEVNAYLISKRQLYKSIGKLFQNLKRMQKKSTSNKECNQVVAISTLTQVEEISLEAFESLLSYISSSKAKSKTNGWSLVSKYLKSKQVSSQGEADVNQVENLDIELLRLVNKKPNKGINFQCLLKQVEALELKIQEVMEELECIYRRLVKTRVSLLNILNH